MSTDRRRDPKDRSSSAASTAATGRTIRVGARTDVGRVREENQDRISRFSSPIGEVFLVVDGMGGHRGGALAAEMTVQGLERHLQAAEAGGSPEEILAHAATRTNREIHERATSGQKEMEKMGATAALLLIRDRRARVAHAGDSRVYLMRGSELTRLTRDHTVVQRMIDHNLLNEEEARDHPDASVVSRAFGRGTDFELEVSQPFDLLDGDRLLICSDGLCGYVDDDAIAQAMAVEGAQAAADRLIELALAAGGEDNVSVQLVFFRSEDAPPPAALEADLETSSKSTLAPTRGVPGRGRLVSVAAVVWVLIALSLGVLICYWLILPRLRGKPGKTDNAPAAAEPSNQVMEALPGPGGREGSRSPGTREEPDLRGPSSPEPSHRFRISLGGSSVYLDVFDAESMPGPDAPPGEKRRRLRSGRVYYPAGLRPQAESVADILGLEIEEFDKGGEVDELERGRLAASRILVIVFPDSSSADNVWNRAQLYFEPGFEKQATLLVQKLRLGVPKPLGAQLGAGDDDCLVVTLEDAEPEESVG